MNSFYIQNAPILMKKIYVTSQVIDIIMIMEFMVNFYLMTYYT